MQRWVQDDLGMQLSQDFDNWRILTWATTRQIPLPPKLRETLDPQTYQNLATYYRDVMSDRSELGFLESVNGQTIRSNPNDWMYSFDGR